MNIQDPYAVSYGRSDQQESGVDLLLGQVSGEREDREQSRTPVSFCGRCVKLPETRCGKLLLGAGIIVAVGLVGTLFSIPMIARSICVQPENTIKLNGDSQDNGHLGRFYSAQVDRISLRENLEVFSISARERGIVQMKIICAPCRILPVNCTVLGLPHINKISAFLMWALMLPRQLKVPCLVNLLRA